MGLSKSIEARKLLLSTAAITLLHLYSSHAARAPILVESLRAELSEWNVVDDGDLRDLAPPARLMAGVRRLVLSTRGGNACRGDERSYL